MSAAGGGIATPTTWRNSGSRLRTCLRSSRSRGCGSRCRGRCRQRTWCPSAPRTLMSRPCRAQPADMAQSPGLRPGLVYHALSGLAPGRALQGGAIDFPRPKMAIARRRPRPDPGRRRRQSTIQLRRDADGVPCLRPPALIGLTLLPAVRAGGRAGALVRPRYSQHDLPEAPSTARCGAQLRP